MPDYGGDAQSGLSFGAGGALAGAPFGPAGAAIGGGLGLLYGIYKNESNKSTANKYKGDLTAAVAGNDARMNQLKQFYLDQQKQALGFYSPVQSMFQQAYGKQGIAAPEVPQAPGAPLSQMYGGR